MRTFMWGPYAASAYLLSLLLGGLDQVTIVCHNCTGHSFSRLYDNDPMPWAV